MNERGIIDLFAGLGGFSLAAHWNGIEPAAQVEINPHCRNFLARAWPDTVQWGDINTFLDVCQKYVHTVNSDRFLRVTPLASRAIQSVSENGGREIESIIGPSSASETNGKDSKSSLIMAVSALAAGNPLLSFLHWITSTTTETRREKPLFASRLGKSPSSENCPGTIIKSSASTAITHGPSTEYVLIKLWLLAGGPPCQPSSRAGEQRGQTDNRWLWPQTIRATHLFNPTWVCYENPPGILNVGLDGILADLEGLGYEVQPLSIPACAVDSPQDRERIWILGHRCEPGLQERELQPGVSGKTRCGGQRKDAAMATESVMGHAKSVQREWKGRTCRGTSGPAEMGAWSQYEWLPCPDPKRGTVLRRAPVGLYDLAYGVSDRIPRKFRSKLIEALGNAIVPQVAAEIISAMIQSENA